MSMNVKLGIFVVPDATEGALTVEQIVEADRSGLEIIGIQDHPYQRRYYDTWTLLSYAAARTERIRLGLGAGAFWDAIKAMGGPRRTPKESVDALEETVAILRAYWSGERSIRVDGEHYHVAGTQPGPPPSHPISIWLGAYGPRMLRMTGRLADGWMPSLGAHYLSPSDAPRGTLPSTRRLSAPGATRPTLSVSST